MDVILHGGHRLITSLGSNPHSLASGVGILVHSIYVPSIIRMVPGNDRVMGLDIRLSDRICMAVSVYLPHAGYVWADFVFCLEIVFAMVREAQERGYSVIVAGDFNSNHLHHGPRGQALQELSSQFQLSIVNGHGPTEGEDNWTFKSSLGVVTRIDYILAIWAPGIGFGICDV